jgi:hypothetical protein
MAQFYSKPFAWLWIAGSKTEIEQGFDRGTSWNASKDLGSVTETTEIANLIKSLATVGLLKPF